MGKTVAIIQSNYIPWKGYFDLINRADDLVIYDCCQYTKNDWRNRNLIKTPHGKQWLTIPVYHKLNQRIDETIISDKYWNTNHWKTIQQFYCQSPYFDLYFDLFEDLYLNNDSPYLSSVNFRFIESICFILGIDTIIRDSSEFELLPGQTERLVGICQQLGADRYISGPAAKNYIDIKKFDEADIKIEWMSYNYSEYPQLYPPFDHQVTILDLIFNTGREAMKYVA